MEHTTHTLLIGEEGMQDLTVYEMPLSIPKFYCCKSYFNSDLHLLHIPVLEKTNKKCHKV